MQRPPSSLHSVQDGILWREEEVLRRLEVTRLKSGVSIIRAIHITALKRGESEEPTSKNMRIIVRSETPPL